MAKKNHKETILTKAQKNELDYRIELHQSGKSKSFTWEEVETSIIAKINTKN